MTRLSCTCVYSGTCIARDYKCPQHGNYEYRNQAYRDSRPISKTEQTEFFEELLSVLERIAKALEGR